MATPLAGKDLKVGDTLDVLGTPQTITGFAPHPGLAGEPARIALYERNGREAGITVFDSDPFVTVDGVIIPRHHWHG